MSEKSTVDMDSCKEVDNDSHNALCRALIFREQSILKDIFSETSGSRLNEIADALIALGFSHVVPCEAMHDNEIMVSRDVYDAVKERLGFLKRGIKSNEL